MAVAFVIEAEEIVIAVDAFDVCAPRLGLAVSKLLKAGEAVQEISFSDEFRFLSVNVAVAVAAQPSGGASSITRSRKISDVNFFPIIDDFCERRRTAVAPHSPLGLIYIWLIINKLPPKPVGTRHAVSVHCYSSAYYSTCYAY